MPFGLKNAPGSFQKCLEIALSGLLWKSCFLYIHDILIIGRTFEEHLENFEIVFQHLHEANLNSKLKKCNFLCKSVLFLGHVVSGDGISIDPAKVEKVQNFPPPTNISALKRFLGLASYCRRFCKDFSKVAAPLNSLLQKTMNFHWSPECSVAFEKLKFALITPPVLAYPNFCLPFKIQMDARGSGVGAVLAQGDEGYERPIDFASRSLNKSERRYPTIEQEALAIIFALKQFCHYIYGYHCIIQTDHAPLKWLLSKPQNNGRLSHWAISLMQYDLEIQYKTGKTNLNADALSRMYESPKESACVNSVDVQGAELATEQKTDPDFQQIFAFLQSGELPSDDASARRVILSQNFFSLLDGMLYFVDSNVKSLFRLALPKCRQSEVLEGCHDVVFAGHFGFYKTLEKVRSRYFWPGLIADVKHWVQACRGCAMCKPPPKGKIGRLWCPFPFLVPLTVLQLTAWDL